MTGNQLSGSGIAVLCTANVCRSPMAAALLGRHLTGLGVPVTVWSAGLLRNGEPPPVEVVQVMAGYGLDVGSHRSHVVSAADLAAAALVLGMEREHVRHAVVAVPAVWPRAFTLKELVRRASGIGPRPGGESLAAWLSRVHAGRDRAALLGGSPADDVADPMGGPLAGYAATAALLDQLAAQLADLGWAHVAAGPHAP